MFQVGHELGVVLHILTFGDVDYCTDDLSHTAVFVATKHLVASMKPPPEAATNAAPEFKISSFALAQSGESVYVVHKGLPVVRMYHRADEARLRQLLARNGAERVRDSAIDEDDSLLPHIVDGNTTWQSIDDVLEKALVFDYRFDPFSDSIKQDAEDRTGESQAELTG